MQKIKIFVCADSVVGQYRDEVNASSAQAPMIVKGVEVLFSLRLFDRQNSPEPYNIELLQRIPVWKFAIDYDFNEETAYILEADNEKITVNRIEEEQNIYTEISIPIPETNTVQLKEWMGEEKSKSGLVGELSGYDSDGRAVFVLQLENMTVRNRLGGTGSPEGLDPDYLTEAQVRALVKTEAAAASPRITSEGTWEVAGIDTQVSASGPAAGFGTVSAEIEMLPPGSQASAEVETSGPDTKKDMIFKLAIPEVTGQGSGGITGKILFDMTGSLSDKVFYDDEKKYFTYLTTGGDLYVKLSDASGDWSEPVHIAPVRGVDYWTDEDKDTIKNEMLNKGW